MTDIVPINGGSPPLTPLPKDSLSTASEVEKALREEKKRFADLYLLYRAEGQESEAAVARQAEAESKAIALGERVELLEKRLTLILAKGPEALEQEAAQIAEKHTQEQLQKMAEEELRERHAEGLKTVTGLLAKLRTIWADNVPSLDQAPSEEDEDLMGFELVTHPQVSPPVQDSDDISMSDFEMVELPKPFTEAPHPDKDPALILRQLQIASKALSISNPEAFIEKISRKTVMQDDLDWEVVLRDGTEEYEFPGIWRKIYRSLWGCEQKFDQINGYFGKYKKVQTVCEWSYFLGINAIKYGGPAAAWMLWLII